MQDVQQTHVITIRPVGYKIAVIAIVVIPFLAVFYAIWQAWNKYVTIQDLLLMLVLYTLITMGGVTMGLHRYFTHRSFKTNPFIKYTLGVLSELSLQGGIISWVADHRLHHQFSDKEGDLHSPSEGLWHAHIGWIWAGTSANEKRFAPDLLKDRWLVMMDKAWLAWWVLSIFTIPFLLGGWSGVLWAGLVRIFLVHHATWSINSICHTFGERPFETDDTSGNVWWLSWLTFGESNHNTHHKFPASAQHGTNYINDPTYLTLLGMKKLGLVWDIILPKDEVYLNFRKK